MGEITRSTEDTSGELFEATNWIEPHMPGPPVHVHPTAEESYEVIEGALEVFMNGEWSPVRAGEKATVAQGVPHSVRNASDEPARIVNIHQPAQRLESFFRDMHRRDPSDETTKSGLRGSGADRKSAPLQDLELTSAQRHVLRSHRPTASITSWAASRLEYC